MEKVLIAMSGGVDSSVAAALLKKQGYFGVGGYMKNFSPESWEGVLDQKCPWERDVEDVASVCGKLGIPYRSFNFEEEYREKVIEYFFREYAAGRTPNPDAICNREIKFGIFLEKAMELGFDYIATGHYVRLPRTKLKVKNEKLKINKEEFIYKLYEAKDENKDQSYFLYGLNQYQLSKSLFPIGEYTKPQIRELARKFGLPNADKKDSQGVCFVGQIKLKDFLNQRIPEKIGDIVTEDGRKIGSHKGVAAYTIGQRQGISLPSGPYYVAQKNLAVNTLVVTKDPSTIVARECAVRAVNWISGEEPELPMRVYAKIRYRSNAAPVRINACGPDELRVVFEMPERFVSQGQCAVFYTHEGEMLGGGIIG